MQDIISQAQDAIGKVAELKDAFEAIQQPRSDYVLRHFVVGEKDTQPQAYLQCVLEMQIKYDNIRLALLEREKLTLQIAALGASGTALDNIEAAIKGIHLEQQERALLGALREFWALYAIWQGMPRYTHQEIQEDQQAYWRKRLLRQANQDLQAGGRIGQGNQDALRQVGITLQPIPGVPVLGEIPGNGLLPDSEKGRR
jgi:hypothetical protein